MRIKASTLLEVVVSLVIIMVIFGIAMMIYVNVLNSSHTEREMNCYRLLKNIAEETRRAKRYFDEDLETNGIHIFKTIRKYRGQDNLLHCHLETQDGQKTITLDQLIIVNQP